MKRKFLSAPVLLILLVLFNNPTKAQVKSESSKADLPKSIRISSVRSDGSGETEMNYTQGGRHYRVLLNGSKIVEMYVDDKKIAESDFAKYEPDIRKILEQIEEDRKQADKDREEVNKMREQAGRDREQANRERERANVHREQAEKDRAQAEVHRKKAEEDRRLMEAMFDELVTDKLVTDRESLTSLELDETKLIVNGKEQSSGIHQRYKQKYLKDSQKRLQYNRSAGNRTLTVN